MKTNILFAAILAMSALLFTACPPAGDTNNSADNASNESNGMNTGMNSDSGNSTNEMAGENDEPTTDIVEGATASSNHTTLVAAVKAAELVETLKGDGPFTVFAPTNAAFDKLPEGTVETLLKPENIDQLKGILTYHVVAGSLDSAAVAKAIEDGDGKATLKTVQGEEITAELDGENVVITDAKGGKSKVTAVDLKQSNGVIHVIDTVLMPSK
ncbi:MAG: fasciclin domain-containing protein [Acidobacteria bacterium]|nr:MAG: fasciclin domain-containing protein [Acidobacteriota bacterium]REJ98908.1 MAG: fasciclin domain-containing protein [Acidobacteriota bacterium]REK16373.1 MAG: fasciclin domain-containing protein [Acidobacteriota bacterium]REK44054.1 MAG: fasciclin domain-containing protein [Acidobacteriota bacterium]